MPCQRNQIPRSDQESVTITIPNDANRQNDHHCIPMLIVPFRHTVDRPTHPHIPIPCFYPVEILFT